MFTAVGVGLIACDLSDCAVWKQLPAKFDQSNESDSKC